MNSSAFSIREWHLPLHAGKSHFERNQMRLKEFTNKNTKIIYSISKQEIESGDIAAFLAFFGRDVESELIRHQGKVSFVVEGYDDHPEPLFAIPAVRNFFSACHKKWPCWNFFGDLETDCLAIIACCVIPNLFSIVRQGTNFNVSLKQSDLISFFEECLPATAILHAKAGFDPHSGVKLLQAVANYLQLSHA